MWTHPASVGVSCRWWGPTLVVCSQDRADRFARRTNGGGDGSDGDLACPGRAPLGRGRPRAVGPGGEPDSGAVPGGPGRGGGPRFLERCQPGDLRPARRPRRACTASRLQPGDLQSRSGAQLAEHRAVPAFRRLGGHRQDRQAGRREQASSRLARRCRRGRDRAPKPGARRAARSPVGSEETTRSSPESIGTRRSRPAKDRRSALESDTDPAQGPPVTEDAPAAHRQKDSSR
jgi:hypothetical protein